MEKQNRINFIDLAKFIGIILVIYAHTLDYGKDFYTRGIIYSFHMPLFFILSGYTTKLSTNFKQLFVKTKYNFKKLITPTVILFLIMTVIYIISHFNSINWGVFIKEKFLTYIFASGVNININGLAIHEIGYLWFLFVLFLSKLIYDFLNLINTNKCLFIIQIILLTVIGYYIGYNLPLPFSFDIALFILIFLCFGDYLKNINFKQNTIQRYFLNLFLWLITYNFIFIISGTYLELAGRRYPIFPLCLASAIFGTLFILYFSFYISSKKFNLNFLYYLGKNSLIIYLIHVLDYNWGFLYNITDLTALNGIIRIGIDIIICIIFLFINKKIHYAFKNEKIFSTFDN